MGWFGKITLHIRNLSPEVAMHHMVTTLRPRQFADSLCMQPTVEIESYKIYANEGVEGLLKASKNKAKISGDQT